MRLFFAAFVVATSLSMPAPAAPVEYVKICHLYGAGWSYIPGTDTCVNASTGETRTNTEFGVVEGETEVLDQAKDANEGVALSLALPNASVDAGKTFGAAVNIGTFNGETALGVGGAVQFGDGFTFNGAVGVGLGRGTVGGTAGMNFSW